ncbi:MAG: carbohydrate binding domain-containing protein [Clostridia bacterium]|nr:carbohydrate binding domain-containing protein [Clostridia bacterium]
MKRMAKRVLALMLVAVMLLTTVPFSAAAASYPAPNAAALNFGFEQGSDKPSGWTYPGNGTLSLSTDCHEGSYAAQLKNVYGTANNILESADFTLMAGADYQLSFWIKTDMVHSGYVDALIEQKGEDGAIIKTTGFEWPYRIYEDTDWRMVRLFFTAVEGATNASVQFRVMGTATTVLLDDVSVMQTTPIANFDFEELDARGEMDSWYLSVARNSANVFQQDTTRFHSGRASLYTEIDSMASERQLVSSKLLTLQNTSNRIYEVSAWVSSRNCDATLLRFELLYYDENGAKIGAMEGTQTTLNAGSTASEWKQIITRKTIPDNVVYVRPVFVFAGNKAEIWIDDVFVDLVEDDNDIVAVHNDFHAVDQDGKIAGWEKETTGTATLEQKTDATEGTYGHLSVTAGTGAMKYTTNVFGTNYEYSMVVRYKSDLITNAVLKFYDFQKDEYVEKRIEEILPATEAAWREEVIEFNAPSATFCEILLGPQGTGTLDVSQLVIYQSADPVKPDPVRLTVSAVHGEVKDLIFDFEATLNLEEAIAEQFPIRLNVYTKNQPTLYAMVTAQLLDHTDMTAWPVGEDFTVSMRVELPDYMVDGTYSLQLPTERFTVTNEDVYENRFLHFTAVNDHVAGPLETALSMKNDEIVYTVNGDVQSKFWFESSYLEVAGMKTIYQSGIETVVTFDGDFSRLWLYNGFNYAEFDRQIYVMLSAAPEANFIISLGVYAPSWWLDAHPDEQVYLSDKNDNLTPYAAGGVSFGSSLWLEESNALIAEILDHMKKQPYYSHVAGIRLAAGRTAEMFPYVEDGKITDYSPAALSFFKNWAAETYGSLDALNAAWGTELSSFDEITLPTYAEFSADGGWGCLLNPETQQRIIDYRLVLDEMTATCLETWSATVKECTDRKLIVGTYYGYNFNGAGGTGTSHTAMQRILTKNDIDFFCAPLGYNERQLGQSSFSQAVLDSIRAYGKLVVSEQDNRSVLTGQFAGASWTDRDNSVGNTHTMDETLLQEKRDFAYNLINGNGQYLMDMYDGGTHDPMFSKPVGGWWDDPQVYEFTNVAVMESLISAGTDKSLKNDIALIVPDDYSGYYRPDSQNAVAVAQGMYRQQRRYLGISGAGYDVYSLSALADGKMPEHKINMFLTSHMLTSTERAAIDTYCKTNDQINVFFYMDGVGDEDGYDLANMTELTGFAFGLNDHTATGQVKITNADTVLTAGLMGKSFGLSTAASIKYYDQEIYVDVAGDDDAVVLGTHPETGNVGFAMKDMGNWTSIYSSAPHLAAGIYRNLLNMAGAHIYSDDPSDLIYANSAYVALHSTVSGEKTIRLPSNYAVYDVYEQKMVSSNTDSVTFYNRANDTHLFRLMPAETYSLLSHVSGGNGNVSLVGVEQVSAGASKTLTFTPDAGYVLKSVTVNGTAAAVSGNTLTISNIRENTTVVAEFTPEASTREWVYTFDSGMLQNGSFEENLDGWTFNADAVTRVNDGMGDSWYGMKIDASTGIRSANSERIAVSPNTEYCFNFALKGDAAAVGQVRAVLYDANDKMVCYGQPSFIHRVRAAGDAPEEWTAYTKYFKTTPNAAYVVFSLYTEKGVLYYDSLSLTPHEHVDNDGDEWCDVTNMYHLQENTSVISTTSACGYAFAQNPSLFDGRFDLDTKLIGVNDMQNAKWAEREDADGSRQSGSLKLVSTAEGDAYYYRAVAVQPNTVYTLALQTKFADGGNLRLLIYPNTTGEDAALEVLLQSADTAASATSWKQKVVNFKTGADTTGVYLCLVSDTIGTCYVDNWEVRLHEHAATDPKNGDYTCAEGYYDLSVLASRASNLPASSSQITACDEMAKAELITNGQFSVIPHGNTVNGAGSTYGDAVPSIFAHWQANSGTIAYSTEDRRGYTASGSIVLTKTGGTSADFMTRYSPNYYAVTEANRTYQLSFWYKTDAVASVVPRLVAYTADSSSAKGVELTSAAGQTDGWQHYVATVRLEDAAYVGNTRVQFYLRSAETDEVQTLYVDDISLTPIADHEHSSDDADYACDYTIDYLLTAEGWQKTAVCGYDMTPPTLVGASMTLGTVFEVNFGVKVYNYDPASVTVVLDDLPEYAVQKDSVLTLGDAPDPNTGCYMLTVKVAAAHLYKPIRLTLYVDGRELTSGSCPSITYSVPEYAQTLIEGHYTDAQKAAAKAMLNYGANAQRYFSVATETLANAALADADRMDADETAAFYDKILATGMPSTEKEDMEDESEIILPDDSFAKPAITHPIDRYRATTYNKLESFIGYSMLLRENFGLRMYFSSADVTVTVDGQAAELIDDSDSDNYYVEISGLSANQLQTAHRILATENGQTMTVVDLRMLTPARTVARSSKQSTNYRNVSIALILYAEAVADLAAQ